MCDFLNEILYRIPLAHRVRRAEHDDAARRFVELIDELYDRRVNVIVSAATSPDALYRGERMARGFARTASRLHEFQSTDYLSSAHRP
jgi:cell division protein ZapE